MKRLMLLFCLLASFIACSDDKDNPEEPEMPITDLQLPTVNPVAGDNVKLFCCKVGNHTSWEI